MSEITDRITKSDGMALLFENNGTGFPVLMNVFGSDERMCMALGINDMGQPAREMESLFKEIAAKRSGLFEQLGMLGTLKQVASWMPELRKGRGACQEVVMETPDLSKLPILTCWPFDGGPFVTLPVVHTVDPVTGTKNAGMYRMQVFGPDMTGMHWHLHKNSARHYRAYKEKGLRMPVTVTLGGDPAYTYAATAPLPDNVDEMLLAGFLRKKKVELVKCITNNIEVPSDVDFVIEGYVDPAEELLMEGPFGDHTGFYSLADLYPRFHVTCITHRKNAIYPACIVGIPPQEDAWIGKATERIFLYPIRMSMLPEIRDMHMPVEGVFHNVVIVSIKNEYQGQASKVMNALWGAGQMMFNKVMIVVDERCDVHDYAAVLNKLITQVSIDQDIYFSRGPADVLDHSSQQFAFGGKMGLDATTKYPETDRLPSIDLLLLKQLFEKEGKIHLATVAAQLPVLLVFLNASEKEQLRALHAALAASEPGRRVKYIVYCDYECAGLTEADLVWIVANHIDPQRDCFITKIAEGISLLGIDGTTKNQGVDAFKRDWPNPVVMDEETIRKVDAKWNALGLGPLIPSPSLKYQKLFKGSGAVAFIGHDAR
jgi:4-hydroxy-3-polyprenylbenzoate decarboxylase